MSHDPIEMDESINEYLTTLEIYLLKRYDHYLNSSRNIVCKVKKCQASLLDYEPFNLNFPVLKEAINQIRMDIKILLWRRGNLIGNMRISEGKVAGIITFRLAKAHSIHIHRNCNVCQHKCFLRVNSVIAIRIGLDYIHKKHTDLPEGIRNELLYTIKHRHTNQETLGLVFDTLKELQAPKTNTSSVKK